MSNPKTKTKRERTNTGSRGAKKNPQSFQNLILLGKGPAKSIKHVQCTSWKGASDPAVPFDAEQAKKNWAEGYCN